MKKLSTKYRNKLSKNKGKDRCRTYFYIQPSGVLFVYKKQTYFRKLCSALEGGMAYGTKKYNNRCRL